MPENRLYLPEGLKSVPEFTLSILKEAMETEEILEAIPKRCDVDHNLFFQLNGISATMMCDQVNAPWISGANRSISVISRVGKQTCFTVSDLVSDEKGAPVAVLSRRNAQEKVMQFFLEMLKPGMILTCCVTHTESFGVFLDIGCGIIAMLPIEHISISRIPHPKERFRVGQKILAAVLSIDRDRCRITMTHRELLGTWMENASLFQPGETVSGVVRSVQNYGSFVELTPNLSGLTDVHEGLVPGDHVSVFIKSMDAARMKIKLQLIEKLPGAPTVNTLQYYVTDGTLTRWQYSPKDCEKMVETVFTAVSL
jgi:small subunit ribosomal protein S1